MFRKLGALPAGAGSVRTIDVCARLRRRFRRCLRAPIRAREPTLSSLVKQRTSRFARKGENYLRRPNPSRGKVPLNGEVRHRNRIGSLSAGSRTIGTARRGRQQEFLVNFWNQRIEHNEIHNNALPLPSRDNRGPAPRRSAASGACLSPLLDPASDVWLPKTCEDIPGCPDPHPLAHGWGLVRPLLPLGEPSPRSHDYGRASAQRALGRIRSRWKDNRRIRHRKQVSDRALRCPPPSDRRGDRGGGSPIL